MADQTNSEPSELTDSDQTAADQGKSEQSSMPPGWYSGNDPRFEHYWDGQQWRLSTTRATDPGVELDRQDHRIQVYGWITAILVPLIGFVLGGILAGRGRRVGMGVAIMFTAIVLSIASWFFVLTAIVDEWDDSADAELLDDSSSYDDGSEDDYYYGE